MLYWLCSICHVPLIMLLWLFSVGSIPAWFRQRLCQYSVNVPSMILLILCLYSGRLCFAYVLSTVLYMIHLSFNLYVPFTVYVPAMFCGIRSSFIFNRTYWRNILRQIKAFWGHGPPKSSPTGHQGLHTIKVHWWAKSPKIPNVRRTFDLIFWTIWHDIEQLQWQLCVLGTQRQEQTEN